MRAAALLLTLTAAVAVHAEDSSSPLRTDLYKEVQVSDPDGLYVPALAMKHIVQLPNRVADPLSPENSVPAGRVRRSSISDGSRVVVETETFSYTISVVGDALHLVARRVAAADADVYPALAVKDARPPATLILTETPDAMVVSRAEGRAEVCRVLKADGTVVVAGAWGAGPDRYRAAWSSLQKRVFVTTPLTAGERLYGLGMKSGALDRRGRRFTMWNSDTFGYHEGTDPLYASIPFLLRKGGPGARGLFVDDASDVVFDLGFSRADEASISTTSAQADLYLFAAPVLNAVVSSYQALTGSASLPPVWALGYHQSAHTYFPQSRVVEIAETFRAKDIPADALYLDIIHQDQYRPFTWNAQHFPEPRKMTDRLHALGFKAVAIVDPGIQANDGYPLWKEGRARNYFLKADDGRLYVNNVWPGYSAFPDFLQRDVRDWWAQQHRAYMDAGIDAFKNDMSEPATFYKQWAMLRYDETTKMPGDLEQGTIELGTVSQSDAFGRVPHRAFHNAYGLYEAMATAKAQEDYDQRRPFVLMRNAFSSSQRYTALWTGDISADWPSLRNTVGILLSLNLAGFPLVGADNGGFAGRSTPELFTRWTELSAFTPFFRTHYFYVDQSIDKEPWSFGPDTEKVVAAQIRLRYRLLPYLYTSLHDAIARRGPLMQPLFTAFEEDERAAGIGDEYTLGAAFLVAPVLEPGVRGRSVYLPKGEWYDFWTGERVVSAGESRFVSAPLERIPVFVSAGHIVPGMDVVPSTSGHFPPKHVILDVYPEASGGASGSLYLDDGETRGYLTGRAATLSLSVAGHGPSLDLKIETAGDASFAPERLTVRVHGATAARTLRFDGHAYPLTGTAGVASAEIPLR